MGTQDTSGESLGAGLCGLDTAVCIPAVVQQLQQYHRGGLHLHGRARPSFPGSSPSVVGSPVNDSILACLPAPACMYWRLSPVLVPKGLWSLFSTSRGIVVLCGFLARSPAILTALQILVFDPGDGEFNYIATATACCEAGRTPTRAFHLTELS